MTQPSTDEVSRFDARAFLGTLTSKPGVYRMLDADGKILYVGKARNLRKRVSSYFRRTGNSVKTRSLIAQVRDIQVTVTHTENEALILESNLIKEHKPRYNVLLRDDKSYPYIHVSTAHAFPRLALHRGARRAKGRYFGPYPSAQAVHESLNLLQKVFRVRQCEDGFFRNRSRPCLQYQIQRCSGPCVGLITEEDYAKDVRYTELFLEGRNETVVDDLVERMEAAAAALDYEAAARIRDQIGSLRRVQERQYVSGERGDLDIVAACVEGGVAAVQIFFVRSGRNLGNRSFFPTVPEGTGEEDVLSGFISQFYLERPVPDEILTSAALDDASWIERALASRAGRRISVRHDVRGERRRWVRMARQNAELAIKARLASFAGMRQRLESLAEALDLEACPQRMECFDISHTSGEATVASCVVFGEQGPLKSDYRRFNIEGITPGDDYAAMAQALTRRYTRLKTEDGPLPDVLFIDGGKGQVGTAREILRDLQVADVLVVGVAKGRSRKPGMETLLIEGRAAFGLAHDSPALHLIQQIRDEAHRFAITGHRQRRGRRRRSSTLEDIPGVGPARRQRLLKQFGGLREVARAGAEDLARVKGISPQLAQKIYDAFHG